MDHKTLFGAAALLASAALFVRSLQPAYAEIGPSVSYGSNPVFSFGGSSGDGSLSLVSAPSNQDMIIDGLSLTLSTGSHYCDSGMVLDLVLDSGEQVASMGVLASGGYFGSTFHPAVTHNTRIRVPAGSQLQATISTDFTNSSSYCAARKLNYTISGHYTHP